MSKLTAYLHPTCRTCEQARQWFRRHEVTFVEKDIRITPPSLAELRAMLAAQGGEHRKLFNTSGLEYRAQGLAAKLPSLDAAAALALLAGSGMLVKRPFVLGSGGVGLVGFNEKKWAAALRRA